jgi:hypothetical protein
MTWDGRTARERRAGFRRRAEQVADVSREMWNVVTCDATVEPRLLTGVREGQPRGAGTSVQGAE